MKLNIIFFFLIQTFLYSEDSKNIITKIAFGSCMEQWNPQKIWKPIIESKPDLFLWLGDNIYFDSYIAEEKKFYYNLLVNRNEYKELKKIARMLYTWDDHDYGINDSGADYKERDISQRIFLEAFEEKKDSPRWTRPGIYDSYYFGTKGKRVQIIMLDTRYFRSNLNRSWLKLLGIKKNIPNNDDDATMLGEAQWKWLESELDKEADLRIIVSSVQVANDTHSFEKWGNFPKERNRFFNLIKSKKLKHVILLSGDRHLSELSAYTENMDFPIFDFTSSSLNKPFKFIQPENNPLRIGEPVVEENFGLIKIDWNIKSPKLIFEIIDSNSKKQFTKEIFFSEIE